MDPMLERFGAALGDRYRLERELGGGGMATVFLAEDLRHRRSVALKVLDPRLAASLGPARFLREIEFAARLVHPHILGLLVSGEAEGLLYYVMPYVPGDSLRARLQRDGELPVDAAVRVLHLRNIEEKILGDRYEEDSIMIEPGASHFDLLEPEKVERHLDAPIDRLPRRAV